MIKLSILICSLNSRAETRKDLLKGLIESVGKCYVETQFEKEYSVEKYIGKDAEVIVVTDSKQMSVGAKRNMLLKEASGEYIVFVDDDDRVSYHYTDKLLEKTALKPDVIVFDVARYHNGKQDRMVSYGIEHGKDYNTGKQYFRIPNHLMCVKKELALRVKFKNISFGEDAQYAAALLPLLKKQERINETLYAYYFDDKLTETAKKK